MKIIIKKDFLLVIDVLIFFLLFSPQFLKTFPLYDTISSYLKMALMFLFIFWLLIKNKITKPLIAMVLICLTVVFSTILENDNYMLAFGQYYTMIGTAFFVELQLKQMRRCLAAVLHASFILVSINFICMLLYPKGIYVGSNQAAYWFIGQKQDFGSVFVIAFVVGLLLWKYNKKEIVMMFAMMLYSLLNSFPLGLILTLFIIIIMLFITKVTKIVFQPKFLFVINIVSECFVVFLTFIYSKLKGLQSFLATIQFLGGMNKADTILSRILMWRDSIDIVKAYPIIGAGYISKNRYYHLAHFSTFHPVMHNMMINIAVTGGFVSLSLYVYLTYLAFKRCGDADTREKRILSYSLFAFNVLCLTEAPYWPFTFALFILCNYSNEITEQLKESPKC